MRLLGKVEFVADFRTAMSWWSMKLGVVASMAVGYVVANPDDLKQLADYLPAQFRGLYSFLVSVAVFGLIYFTRTVKQKSGNPDG